jgi:hypothetical protein
LTMLTDTIPAVRPYNARFANLVSQTSVSSEKRPV